MGAATTILPSVELIWTWLSDVADPEIPVLSVLDLGIVRDVSWKQDVLQVDITPTYSGCPATGVIALDIESALLKQGVDHIQINTRLSPAWTTDWISKEGRLKLKNYGIAPPVKGTAVKGTSCAGMLRLDGGELPDIDCPQCDSNETERISQFGSTPCKASYRCKSCLEPFDYFKSF